MSNVQLCLCTLTLHLPGVTSLKQKRGIVKSMLARIRNQFNVSVAEVGENDKWQLAQIAFVSVSNSTVLSQNVIDTILDFIEDRFTDVLITKQDIELI